MGCVPFVAQLTQIKLLNDLKDGMLLLVGLDLVAPAAEHVEASKIPILIHQTVSHFNVVGVYEPSKAASKPEELGVGVALLGVVVDARNHVVTARRLA